MDLEKIKNEIINNPIIKKIISDLNLNENQVNSGLSLFLKIIEENKKKESLEFVTEIQIYDENSVIGISVPNKRTKDLIKRNNYYWLSQISEIDDSISFANPKSKNVSKIKDNEFYWEFPGLEKQNDRKALAQWFKNYYKNRQNNISSNGVYIYGKFGLGKSFFLKALTNYLIEKEITVTYVNISELYEYVTKNVDRNSSLNYEAVSKMKNVSVLIIDDIGNEKQNNWFLFTILYSILEYRLENKLLTCFSSILSISELKKYWLRSKELDAMKIERTIDKIKSLTVQIHLTGNDIRNLKK